MRGRQFVQITRRKKVIIPIWTANLLAFAIAGSSAFLLRFDFTVPQGEHRDFIYSLPIWIVLKAVVFSLFHFHRDAWRFVSSSDALKLVYANVIGSAFAAGIIRLTAGPGFPRSIYVLDFLVCMLLTGGLRIAFRLILELKARRRNGGGTRAFIYGAGEAGVMLLREARCNAKMGYDVIGFIDDDPAKLGGQVHGTPVVGAGKNLSEAAHKYGIQDILIAVPSASGQQMIKILDCCAKARIKPCTFPSMVELINGSHLQIRNVAIEDLLGRTPVRLDEANLRSMIQNQVVMVTGAAGSIGSELCRQIARFSPRTIVGFDLCETGLFDLDREFRHAPPNIEFLPMVGNVQNLTRVREAMRTCQPTLVYHAAAYKHVPMMESHIFEALENNVLGTFNVALAAGQTGVTAFVMISSDKAVRPTSMMGLTKRVAEVLVRSMQYGRTKYVSVRFGNVLGSAGSVVPIFRAQIAAGGPVTVTHPQMQRYFMTIPEATQLVLQASAMGNGGEIFVLDMGEPVKILDLARNLILLSGLRPDEDVRIQFTGIRPGERLYEELSTNDEETLPTYHEKIRVFSGKGLGISDVERWIEDLRQMCAVRDVQLVLALKELIPEYNPSTHVLRQVCGEPGRMAQLLNSAGTVVRRSVPDSVVIEPGFPSVAKWALDP